MSVLRLANGRRAKQPGQSWRCRPDGMFGQTNAMHAGDGEFRVMSTWVGFLPQVEHVSRSITSAIGWSGPCSALSLLTGVLHTSPQGSHSDQSSHPLSAPSVD